MIKCVLTTESLKLLIQTGPGRFLSVNYFGNISVNAFLKDLASLCGTLIAGFDLKLLKFLSIGDGQDLSFNVIGELI